MSNIYMSDGFGFVIHLTSFFNSREVDIMSSLIEKLEKYANNLEDIVNQRTAELVVEKKKTDALLCRMLPKYYPFFQCT